MAPIILDALNFSPVPRFAFGQSTLRDDRRPTVVAHHFQNLLDPRPDDAHKRSPRDELRWLTFVILDRRYSDHVPFV